MLDFSGGTADLYCMKIIEYLELHALHGIAMTSVFHINSIIFLNNGMIFGRALVFSCVVSKLLPSP